MKTKLENVAGKRFLVVDTGIPKTAYREGITQLCVELDKETGETFTMDINMDADAGQVSRFGAVVNGVDGDNYAVVIPVSTKDKVEDIKKRYGSALVKANVGFAKLLDSMKAEAEAIDGIFAGIEE